MSSLIVRNFGGLRLFRYRDEIDLAPDFPRGLFSYLCIRPNRIICRSTLAGELWTDLGTERARKAMNTALWRMRQIALVRRHLVARSKTTLILTLGRRGWVDTMAFEARTRRAFALETAQPKIAYHQIGRALKIYSRDAFLDIDDDWAVEERARLENVYCDALFLHARLAFDAGKYHRCINSCRRLDRFEPYREDVKALHIRALTKAGNNAQALHVGRTFRDLLRSELGVSPEFSPPGPQDAPAQVGGRQGFLAMHREIRNARKSLGVVESQLAALAGWNKE